MSDADATARSRIADWIAVRRDSLRGTLISVCLHATLLLCFAFILLPAGSLRESLFLTTVETVENPAAEIPLEANVMPEQIRDGGTNAAAETINTVNVSDTPSPATVDLKLEPLQLKPTVEEIVGPTARSDQLAGRSEAARAALVQAFGGTSESEAAVSNGLKWLAAHQRDDGSWNFDHRTDECGEDCLHPGNLSPCTVAATSMALLCFLGAGHSHQRGDYQAAVQSGLQYLVSKIEKDQYGASLQEVEGNTGMYAQGLATIVLCEAYGVSRDAQLKAPAQFAVTYICEAQNPRQWLAYHSGTIHDTSVAGWQVMALASGRISGCASRSAAGNCPRSFSTACRIRTARSTDTTGRDNAHHQRSASCAACISVGRTTSRSGGSPIPPQWSVGNSTQLLRHAGPASLGEPVDRNAAMREQLVSTQEQTGMPPAVGPLSMKTAAGAIPTAPATAAGSTPPACRSSRWRSIIGTSRSTSDRPSSPNSESTTHIRLAPAQRAGRWHDRS